VVRALKAIDRSKRAPADSRTRRQILCHAAGPFRRLGFTQGSESPFGSGQVLGSGVDHGASLIWVGLRGFGAKALTPPFFEITLVVNLSLNKIWGKSVLEWLQLG